MGAIRGKASKLFGSLVLVVLLGAFSSSVQALVPVTNLTNGGSINFSNLVAPSTLLVQVGDKLFGNFGFQYTDTTGNTNDYLVASDLVLSALSNTDGFGVSIQVPLVAQGAVTKDLTLEFSAQVVNPTTMMISDVQLQVVGSASGLGVANVAETISTEGFGSGAIANLAVNFGASGATPPGGTDTVTLSAPQSMIWITKDVIVSGDPDGYPETNPSQDVGTISVIDQTFSQVQVPEPSTMALLGAGLAGLLIVRRRK
ncbi:MAG: PEP-CTERM sorting domain-containing protein [Verrucomicrobiia bacterium]|jgi:hypothetical protein